MPLHENTLTFHAADLPHTLFPLSTPSILLGAGAAHFNRVIYQEILATQDLPNFQRQEAVYADKSRRHLRRTVKLDPIAEVFLYDLVYRNRLRFPRDHIPNRSTYGFRFHNGTAVPAGTAYRDFRAELRALATQYTYSLSCDVSAFFNSIYHHDLENFYLGHFEQEDAIHLGVFLRQVNGGRSIDCLPQGLMPSKMLGHHFLRFLDYSAEIRSERMVRFMDDVVLFSNSQETIESDFITIQQLLGTRALNVNPRKTNIGYSVVVHHGNNIDAIRIQLLARRRESLDEYDNDANDEVDEDELTEEQLEYLNALLSTDDLEEHDAELILDLMHDYPSSVIGHVPIILSRFPNLSTSFHRFCSRVNDGEELAGVVNDFVSTPRRITEFQLFWLAKTASSYLSNSSSYQAILHSLYSHPNATEISKAAILELPLSRWGWPDIRHQILSSGRSGWSSWASAVGCRDEAHASRNHLLAYFANGSLVNHVVSQCIREI